MTYANLKTIASTVLSDFDYHIIDETIFIGEHGDIIFSVVDFSGCLHEFQIISDKVYVVSISRVLQKITTELWINISKGSIPELEYNSTTTEEYAITHVEHEELR